MTQEELNKACGFLNARLYPTVKVLNEDLVDVIDRWELVDEFRKVMGAVIKESLTPVLTWENIRRIVEIADQMIQTAHDRVEWEDKSEQAYYTEVLRRFKEEQALTSNPWHKASEELPKEDAFLVCKTGKQPIYKVLEYSSERDGFWTSSGGFLTCKGVREYFTHWMPIPEIKED